jgi:hypothetical protein
MCEKCIELDGKIDRYRRLAWRVTDPRTVDGINELIEKMMTEKIALMLSSSKAAVSWRSSSVRNLDTDQRTLGTLRCRRQGLFGKAA